MLTGEHKTLKMVFSGLDFLERYYGHGVEFLNEIVLATGDETQLLFLHVETKEKTKAVDAH